MSDLFGRDIGCTKINYERGQKQPKPATTAQMRGETFLPMNLNDHVRRNLYFQKLMFSSASDSFS